MLSPRTVTVVVIVRMMHCGCSRLAHTTVARAAIRPDTSNDFMVMSVIVQ